MRETKEAANKAEDGKYQSSSLIGHDPATFSGLATVPTMAVPKSKRGQSPLPRPATAVIPATCTAEKDDDDTAIPEHHNLVLVQHTKAVGALPRFDHSPSAASSSSLHPDQPRLPSPPLKCPSQEFSPFDPKVKLFAEECRTSHTNTPTPSLKASLLAPRAQRTLSAGAQGPTSRLISLSETMIMAFETESRMRASSEDSLK